MCEDPCTTTQDKDKIVAKTPLCTACEISDKIVHTSDLYKLIDAHECMCVCVNSDYI